jgi:hypothetical protein
MVAHCRRGQRTIAAIPKMMRLNSRSRGLLWLGVGLLACAVVGKQWAWPWYVEFSLQKLGWENGSIHCTDFITKRQVPYTWPLKYKPEWKRVYAACVLTVRDATDLARASHIEELELCSVIAPGALAPLARLPRLFHLRINLASVRAEDLRELSGSRSLESIHIRSDHRLGADVYAALAEIKTLQQVAVGGVVTAEELEPLSRLPNLRVLIVPGMEPSPGLVAVFQGMPQLQEIGLKHGLVAYPEIELQLRAGCPNLRIQPDGHRPHDQEEEFPDEDLFKEDTDSNEERIVPPRPEFDFNPPPILPDYEFDPDFRRPDRSEAKPGPVSEGP